MILDKIVAGIRRDLPEIKRSKPIDVSRLRPASRNFYAALSLPGCVRLIAEVKKASPSKGAFAMPHPPARMAEIYERGGAAAVSVVTERNFFSGDVSMLDEVSGAVSIPVLRKDFIIDPFQIEEARLHGADAVLLIAAILDSSQLQDLLDCARRYSMDALVEIHDLEDWKKVEKTDARIVGVNNRCLRTFEVRLDTTVKLMAAIGPGRLVVSESGIFTRSDVEYLASSGVKAVLVGQSVVTSPNPALQVGQLSGVPLPSCPAR